jgi:hypothetical protein
MAMSPQFRISCPQSKGAARRPRGSRSGERTPPASSSRRCAPCPSQISPGGDPIFSLLGLFNNIPTARPPPLAATSSRETAQAYPRPGSPIGHAGLAIAGDSFDYRIIDAVLSPQLGKGTLFKSFDKVLPIPQHYHTRFARWHQLAMLKTPSTSASLSG